jgi:WD40 repeat protein
VGKFSPDGQWLAWLYRDDPTVRVRPARQDGRTGRVGWDLEERPVGLTFSPDGSTIAVISSEGTIKLIPWRLLLEGS